MNVRKLAVNLVLLVIVVAMSFYLYKIIQDPIAFDNARKKRREAAIERLRLVKEAQFAYKDKTGGFAKTWDNLLNTIKYDSIAVVSIIGNPDDLAEDSTAVVIYDTSYALIFDKYFDKDFPIDSLPYVPYTGGEKFKIDAGVIEISQARIKVPVFEVSVNEEVLLKGLNKEYIDKSKDLTLGSMTEGNYNGNW